MLEARIAYGYYGEAGGVTGENPPATMYSTRMPYRVYKQKFSNNKTVAGSYDAETKTIEVYCTDEQMKRKTNYGNRYQIGSYYFLVEVPEGKGKCGWKHGRYVLEFKAKDEINAERNAKKWAKDKEYIVIREATLDEYIHRSELRGGLNVHDQ